MRHNHIAIWIMVVAQIAIGFLWYSPFTFLEPWAYGFGLDLATMGEPNPLAFIVIFVTSVASCYVISWLILRLGIKGTGGALLLGILLWLGVSVQALAPHYMFAQVGKSALIIDLGNSFVVVVVTCLVLTLWRKPDRTIGA